jgi:hypothetical protein
MELEYYELPAHWAVAFFNSDFDHLSDEEYNQFNNFVDDVVKRHGKCWCVDMDNDTFFSSYHDATRFGVLACDVSIYAFDVTPE